MLSDSRRMGTVCVGSGMASCLPVALATQPLLDIYGLDIHEFLNLVMGQLAPIATSLYTAEWETWNHLFDHGSNLAGHRLTGRGTAHQGNRLDQGVLDHRIHLSTADEE